MNTLIKNFLKEIEKFNSPEEWKELSKEIRKKYDEWRELKTEETKSSFSVNELVHFIVDIKDDGNEEKIIGKIEKLNPKKARVKTILGSTGKWNVPYYKLVHATKEDKLKLSIARMSND